MPIINEQKFKVGDKVVPLTKSVWGNLDSSNVWRKAKQKGQNYLYIVGYSSPSQAHILSAVNEGNRGDFFLDKDLKYYEEYKNVEMNFKEKCKEIIAKMSKKLEELKALEKELDHLLESQETEAEVDEEQNIDKEELAEEYLRSKIVDGLVVSARFTEAHFVIKEKKRTVSLVLKGIASGKIWAKTQSKCMAVDDFSAVVGKAICLARALGDKEIEQKLIK